MNKNKQPVRHYRIYALIVSANQVYVGKTTALEMSAVYRRHTKGRCNHTRNTIGHAGNATQLHLLTDLTACTSVAYRHVVAWVHIFLAAGYQVVNQPGIIEDAEDLHPETVRLVNSLLTVPLETILQRTHLPHPADADLPKPCCSQEALDSVGPSKSNPPKQTTQLSVRLEQKEKLAFERYASHMHMTQRDALMYLLSKFGCPILGSESWWNDQQTLKAQKQYQKKIQKLEEELLMAQTKLEQAQSANPETAAPKMTARYRNMQNLVRQYVERINPTVDIGLPLPRGSYKRFVKSLTPGVRYDYPPTEGTFEFSPIAILYGEARPPVHFWIGKLQNGTLCKIRVYYKWDYLGISVMHTDYAVQGMRWLVSIRRAADGAMDLVAALPLGYNTNGSEKQAEKKVPLAQQILEVENRNLIRSHTEVC